MVMQGMRASSTHSSSITHKHKHKERFTHHGPSRASSLVPLALYLGYPLPPPSHLRYSAALPRNERGQPSRVCKTRGKGRGSVNRPAQSSRHRGGPDAAGEIRLRARPLQPLPGLDRGQYPLGSFAFG